MTARNIPGKDTGFVQGELIYYAHVLPRKLKYANILPFSDLHFKNPLFAEKQFMNYLTKLELPENYGVLNGDLIEAVIKTSKGDIYKQELTPQKEAEWVKNKLKPYASKLLGITMGNHEKRIYETVGHDYCSEIARELNIPYRPEGLLLKISLGHGNNRMKDKPYVYWIYMTHGYGGARTKSAKAVKVERTANWIDADAYIMSHDHVANVATDVYLVPDPRTRVETSYNPETKETVETGFRIGSVRAKRKMLVKSGAFLKWGGYAEMGGFPPVDLDMPIIKLHATGTPRVRVEI